MTTDLLRSFLYPEVNTFQDVVRRTSADSESPVSLPVSPQWDAKWHILIYLRLFPQVCLKHTARHRGYSNGQDLGTGEEKKAVSSGATVNIDCDIKSS